MTVGEVFGYVAAAFVALLAFLGRNVTEDVKAHEKKLAQVEKDLAVLAAAEISDRVRALEDELHGIRADLRHIRRWVDSQERGHRHDGDDEGTS